MKLIFKIAFRNLFRHRRRSIVIGIVIFIGAIFMTLSNGMITGMEKGLEINLIDRFMGDIIISATSLREGEITDTRVIGNYKEVEKVLKNQEYIEKFIPVTFGLSIVANLSSTFDERPVISWLVGVDFDKYQEMFDNNIIIVEGEPLKKGERGLLLNILDRERIYNSQNVWIVPEGYQIDKENLTPEALSNFDKLVTKDSIVLMGISENDIATDIRLNVKGIFKNKKLNKLLHRNMKVDLESFRECFGYVTSSEREINLTKENQKLLEIEDQNLDDMFSDDSITKSASANKIDKDNKRLKISVKREKKVLNLDEGAFNQITVKLKEGVNQNESVNKLNEVFASAKLDCRAKPWQVTYKIIYDNIDLLQTVLQIFVYFIFFVAIIVIVNTLSMTAMERSNEIGMMRAVGAQKGFIAKMFIVETTLLTFFFGALGIIAGIVIVFFIASAEIPADTRMLQFLFCNETLQPVVNMKGIIKGVIQLAIVTLIAVIYPAILARRVIPLEAINRD